MQLSSVLMAPARHMYVRLDRRGDNVITEVYSTTPGYSPHPPPHPPLIFTALTIWLRSAAFLQVDPFASSGQRSARVARPSPTLQTKGAQGRKKDQQIHLSYTSDDQTLMDRYVKVKEKNKTMSHTYIYRFSITCLNLVKSYRGALLPP